MTAVWSADVVAPPTKSGFVIFLSAISRQSSSIWYSDGVMRPLTAIMSEQSSSDARRMVSLSTITPRSFTWNPLQVRTMPVMFLPMSWTSPLTVASVIFGLALRMSEPELLSAVSMRESPELELLSAVSMSEPPDSALLLPGCAVSVSMYG